MMAKSNDMAIGYIQELLAKLRGENTKGMLSSRVQAVHSMPEEAGESAEHELSESDVAEILERSASEPDAMDEEDNKRGRAVVGFGRGR